MSALLDFVTTSDKFDLRFDIELRPAWLGTSARPSHQSRLEQDRRRHRAEQRQRHQLAMLEVPGSLDSHRLPNAAA